MMCLLDHDRECFADHVAQHKPQFRLEVCLRSTENWIAAEGDLLAVLDNRRAVERLERGEYVEGYNPAGQRIMYRYVPLAPVLSEPVMQP